MRRLGQRLIASARQAGADEAALAPLDAALVALSGRAQRSRLDGDAAAHRSRRGRSRRARAARDVTILAALGAPVDGAVQTFLLANAPQGGARAESGAMLALASAVERGAIGEGALLAVRPRAKAARRGLDAESVERIIRALRGLRLEDDARRVGGGSDPGGSAHLRSDASPLRVPAVLSALEGAWLSVLQFCAWRRTGPVRRAPRAS